MKESGKRLRWTIYDIAQEAGVSAKTVSKVVNHKPGVLPATRDRIQDIVRRVHYHPHHGARTMRGRGRQCIGVMMAAPPDVVPLSQDFLLWLFAKLSDVFVAKGFYLCFDMVRPTPSTGRRHTDYARGVWTSMFDVGLIVGPLPLLDPVVPRIHQTGLPYVALGRLESFPEGSYATVDFRSGAYKSTRFLLERGHRRIALFSTFEDYQAGKDRKEGYFQALREHGITPDPALIRYYRYAVPATETLAELFSDSTVTAMVDSSVMEDAPALLAAAESTGRKIGTDLHCVVWTYMKDAAVLPSVAAHVWVPVREAAIAGIDRLAAWVGGAEAGPVNLVYQPVLTELEPTLEVRKPLRLYDLLQS